MSDILSLDATSQLNALETRRISAVELLKLSLARHEKTHARLNAVVAADLERALERARAIDERRAAGETIGPLAGLPMTIKDTFDVDGMPASSGVEALRHRKAQDAVVVGHARRAGAVIWGKTNVPVMAADWQSYNDVYKTTNNPWDQDRTPGGSSGGAAAALASGVTALEIGSDIGGSLRVPAAFCGVYSHKPTWGAVSQIGHVPPHPGAHAERDLNVVGPLARSARDLRLMLSVIQGGTVAPKGPPAELNGLRVGLWLDEPAFVLDAEVRTVIEAFAAELTGQGAQVTAISSPVQAEQLLDAYLTLLGATLGPDLPPAMRRQMEMARGPAKIAISMGLSRDSWAGMALAYSARHAEWLEADETRCRLADQLKPAFEKFDVILAPATPVAAFPHDHSNFVSRKLTCSNGLKVSYLCMLRWIALATACRLPATTIPAGLTATGLPVGVQLIGPKLADTRMIAIAEAIEERLGGFQAPPAPDGL
ncbi:MAG: amidase family protein [Caulobacteraceae bacterium]